MEITSTFLTIFLISNFVIISCNDSNMANYILNGTPSKSGTIPYIASLQQRSMNNKHFCGGAIVSRKGIVTVVSCVIGKDPSDVLVAVGIIRLVKDENKKEYFLNKINIHKEYNDTGMMENNIAYLEVKGVIEYSQFIQPVYLPDQTYFGSPDLPPTNVRVAGFDSNPVS